MIFEIFAISLLFELSEIAESRFLLLRCCLVGVEYEGVEKVQGMLGQRHGLVHLRSETFR